MLLNTRCDIWALFPPTILWVFFSHACSDQSVFHWIFAEEPLEFSPCTAISYSSVFCHSASHFPSVTGPSSAQIPLNCTIVWSLSSSEVGITGLHGQFHTICPVFFLFPTSRINAIFVNEYHEYHEWKEKPILEMNLDRPTFIQLHYYFRAFFRQCSSA